MAEKAKNNPNTPRPLSTQIKFWYGFGDFGFTLMTNVETFYFSFFLTNIAMFSVALTGLVMTTASTVDACLSWIYGAILNGVKPGKWGRYRTWLIMVPWIVPFLYAFQFIKIGNDATAAIIITLAAIVSHVVWNFPYAANATMVAVAGGTPEGKATLASSRATWNNISSIAFSYMGLPLATVLAGVVGETNRFGAVAFLLGVIMVVGYWVHFKVTDGYEAIENVAAPSKTKAKAGDMLRGLFQNPNLLLLMVADLSKWVVKFVVGAAAVYYFKYAVNMPGLVVQYVLFAGVAAVIGAYFARYLAKSISNRTTVIVAYAVMSIAMFIAYFMYSSVWVVFGLMLVAQVGYGICYACAPALYADTAVYAEWKTGKSNVGWIMGLQTVPLKVGVILRGIVVAASLAAAGFDAKIDPAKASVELKKGVTAAFALWPAIFVALGFLILLLGYKLSRETVKKYQAEIDARS